MSTTTTTEILSNSNSPCRLLVCLNTLPFHDQRVFRSLLGHIELVRLSACCHSLRSSIRNDTVLWQALYHRDFLSGAYYVKEMGFVLWCIRTDVNNPCTSDKRADLLENVDWYNTYRRRVSTENNWRYGRRNITHINIKSDENEVFDSIEAAYNSSAVILKTHLDGASRSRRYRALEYLPHSNLRSSNNIVNDSTLSTSPNILLLNSGNETEYTYVLGDYYIAVSPTAIESGSNLNVKIFSRKHGDVFTTFDVSVQYEVKAVDGKWVLLVHESYEAFMSSRISGIMVFDIENSIMCLGSIDDTWDATRFYKTTNNAAIVYTAKLVKVEDDVDRIEWALYRFSSNNPIVQLRNGRFQQPEKTTNVSIYLAHNSYDSHMIIELYGNPDYSPYIIHSVASSGQSHPPRNCYITSDQHIPIPLLKAGCKYLAFAFSPAKVWTDLTYDDDQVLQIPRTAYVRHIIGNLYDFDVVDHNGIKSRLIVDINTKYIYIYWKHQILAWNLIIMQWLVWHISPMTDIR